MSDLMSPPSSSHAFRYSGVIAVVVLLRCLLSMMPSRGSLVESQYHADDPAYKQSNNVSNQTPTIFAPVRAGVKCGALWTIALDQSYRFNQ